MPIDWLELHSPPIHFLTEGVGILSRGLADEAIAPAGMQVGSNLPSNTFIKSDQAFIVQI
jgi:hypothetical protein